jgi:hypothetical protein
MINSQGGISKASQADAEAGTSDSTWMSPLKTKQAIDALGGHGQCYLDYTSTTLITLKPENGNRVIIDGVSTSIGTGVTAANTSVFINGTGASNLAADTIYLVCLFDNAGTPTIDFLTVHTHQTHTDGVEIATGDSTRTVVGKIRTNSSSQFQTKVGTACWLISWFNRKNITISGSWSGNYSTTSATDVEVSTTIRAYFISWETENITAFFEDYCWNSLLGAWTGARIYYDTTIVSHLSIHQAGSTNYSGTISTTGKVEAPSETASHYMTVYVLVSSGTGNVAGGGRVTVNLRG